MKDLVLGSITSYGWEEIKHWVNSLDRSGFTGTKMMLCYGINDDVIRELKNRNYVVIEKPDRVKWIVVERFVDYWQSLNGIEDHRYIVSTDVRDVIFQRNPSEWLENNLRDKKINASSESIHYKNETWGNGNLSSAYPLLYDKVKENIINNAGVMSGDFKTMRDLYINIYLLCKASSIRNPDQAAYNVLLSLETYKNITRYTASEEAWAAQAGTTGCPRRTREYGHLLVEPKPILKDGMICTSTGEPFYIVHQYDRVPEWNELLKTKYD